MYAPSIDAETFPTYTILPSPHHTVIEGFWRWLKTKAGLNIKDHILRGKREHIFDSCVGFHKYVLHYLSTLLQDNLDHARHLFNWIFPPLVQAELDGFRTWWNYHRVRSQMEKEMPSGHIPIDALEHPHLYGALDCLIPVPKEAVNHLREYLTEEEGSRSHHLDWVDEEFAAIASDVHQSIGRPVITFVNSWEIFSQMSCAIAASLVE